MTEPADDHWQAMLRQALWDEDRRGRRLRCLGFFFRGLLWLRPVPYHSDYDCWSRGQALSMLIAVAGAFVALLLLICGGVTWLTK